MDLNAKTVLLTGAASGIGLSLARQLMLERSRLILIVNDSPLAQESFDAAGAVDVRIVPMDLSDGRSIETGIRQLGDELSGVDILINNAGVVTGGLFEHQPWPEIERMFAVNLTACVRLAHCVLPHMLIKQEALIVNNLAINAVLNHPGATTYCASKAGMLAFSEALRRELVGTNVRVMTAMTPAVDTPMLHQAKQLNRRYIDVTRWTAVSADEWAQRIIEGIRRNRRIVQPQGILRVLMGMARHTPRLYDLYLKRRFFRDGLRGQTDR